ncbi:hypothetical protein MIDIC_590017 [Alphaproteobacteria bacterium]
MLSFNNRYLNIASILILCYFLLYSFKNRAVFDANFQVNQNYDASTAVFSINIDPNKKYEDYSTTEKVVYHIYKKEIDAKISEIKKTTTATQLDVIHNAESSLGPK